MTLHMCSQQQHRRVFRNMSDVCVCVCESYLVVELLQLCMNTMLISLLDALNDSIQVHVHTSCTHTHTQTDMNNLSHSFTASRLFLINDIKLPTYMSFTYKAAAALTHDLTVENEVIQSESVQKP